VVAAELRLFVTEIGLEREEALHHHALGDAGRKTVAEMVAVVRHTEHFADIGLSALEVSRPVEMKLMVAETVAELGLWVMATVVIA